MVAPAATANQAPLVKPTIRQERSNVVRNINSNSSAYEHHFPTASLSSSGHRRCFAVAASKSPNSNDSGLYFMSRDDLNFLLKVGAGSLVGAAAIKYGSILVPDITQPNITLALIMIFTPVLLSALILIKVSLVEQ